MKRTITFIIFLVTALALAFPMVAIAEDNELDMDAELKAMLEGTEDARHYEFPKIDPEYSVGLGYRMVDNTGLRSLMRFGELDDSALFTGEYRAFYFPHRLYFIYDHESTEDYFGELRYAIGDSIFLRWVGSGVHRNPESVTPIDADTGTTAFGVSVRDQGVEYGIRKNTEDIFLRFKYPDMATHIYFRGLMVHEEGSIQERTLLGSGTFPTVTRDVAKRDYEWETHDYSFGANSHLGPVEMEVEHSDSEFKLNSDPATTSFYSSLGISNTHHLYPDTTSSGNSIKFHTSYTGKLVASATLATSDTENDFSKVSSDYTFTSAGVTWMPATSFTMFLRYKRTDMDYDNSMVVGTLAGIKNGLSSSKEDVSITARFRPTPELVVKGRYKVEVLERDNAAEWGLMSDKTTKTTYMMAVHARQAKKLNLMADYFFTETKDPAYNTEADESHKIKIGADWHASAKVMAFGSYTSSSEKRKDLLFPGGVKADNRQSYRDNALVGLTYMPMERLSTTLSYHYSLSSIKQDLLYDTMGTQAISPDVLYEDNVNCISFDMNYMADEKLSLRAGAHYMTTESSMETNNLDLTTPLSITSLSRKDTTDTTLSLGGQYEMGRNMSVDAEYLYRELSEDYINVYDALENGDVQVASVKVSKKW